MTSLSPVPTSSHATNGFPLLNSTYSIFMARRSERVHIFHWLGLDHFRWIRSSSFYLGLIYWLLLVSKLPIYITILTCLCWTVVIWNITLAHSLSFYDTLDSKFGSTEWAVFELGLRRKRKLNRDSPLRMEAPTTILHIAYFTGYGWATSRLDTTPSDPSLRTPALRRILIKLLLHRSFPWATS